MSKAQDPPRLIALKIPGEDVIKKAFVVCHTTYNEVTNGNPLNAFLTLIGAYYTLNLQYLKMYAGVLWFMETYFLGESEYTGWRSAAYQLLEPRLKQSMAKELEKEQKENLWSVFAPIIYRNMWIMVSDCYVQCYCL